MCHWLADQVFEGNPFEYPTIIVMVHPYRLYPRILSLRLKESQGPVAQTSPLQCQVHSLYKSVHVLSVIMATLIVMAIVCIKCGIILPVVPDKHFPCPPVTTPTPRRGPKVLLAPLLPLPYLPPGWFACLPVDSMFV